MAASTDRAALLRALRTGGTPAVAACAAVKTAIALVPAATALAVAQLMRSLPSAARGSSALVTVPLLAYGLAVFAGYALQDLDRPVSLSLQYRIDAAHRGAVLAAVAALPLEVRETARARELVRVARADADTWIEHTPGEGAAAQLAAVSRGGGALASCAVLAGLAWWLVPLVLVPALAVRSVWRRQMAAHMSTQLADVAEGLKADDWRRTAVEWTGGKEVRTFGLARWAVDRSTRHRTAMLAPRWEAERRTNRAQWRVAVLIGPPLVTAFAAASWQAAHGRVGVALLAAVLTASWSLLQSLVQTDFLTTEGSLPGLRALDDLRALTEEAGTGRAPREDGDAVSAAPAPAGAEGPPLVRFEQVGFRYRGAQHAVLDGLDLEIRPGELLAVVGLNGAGKSTLIKLLCGLYAPTAGRITADGTDIAGLGAAWRRRLGVVFQDFVRYPLSVAENVALGRPGAPCGPAELAAAARASGLDSVVAGLAGGWATPLDRGQAGGTDLSGGQWQQLAIARVLHGLHHGSSILVLDEPTAHLDVQAEFEVFRRLALNRGRASTVLVSHRLSTVRSADRIVLLQDGRIAETGTHEELMARRGAYADLFDIQAERFRRPAAGASTAGASTPPAGTVAAGGAGSGRPSAASGPPGATGAQAGPPREGAQP